jgi:hypothetical protein
MPFSPLEGLQGFYQANEQVKIVWKARDGNTKIQVFKKNGKTSTDILHNAVSEGFYDQFLTVVYI